MFCQKCGNDVQESQFCSKCGAKMNSSSQQPQPQQPTYQPVYQQVYQPPQKQKKKFYKKWWFWVIIVFVFIVAISPSTTTISENATKKEVVTTTEKAITYNSYSAAELYDDLKNNAMKAQSKHEDEYAEITGYLDVIDASGKYITLNAGTDNYEYVFTTASIYLYIKNDTQKQAIMELSKGDKLTIKCHIYSVGEVVGYYANIVEIK